MLRVFIQSRAAAQVAGKDDLRNLSIARHAANRKDKTLPKVRDRLGGRNPGGCCFGARGEKMPGTDLLLLIHCRLNALTGSMVKFEFGIADRFVRQVTTQD